MLDVREPVEWAHGHIDGRRPHPADGARPAARRGPGRPDASSSARSVAGPRRRWPTSPSRGTTSPTSTAACSSGRGRPADGQRHRPPAAGRLTAARLSRVRGHRERRAAAAATASASRREVLAARDLHHAEARQVRGHPLHVDAAAGPRSWSSSSPAQPEQRDLRGVPLAVEHRLAREQPADRHAVQPAGEPPVAPGLDRVHPAQLVQAQVRRPDLRRRSSRCRGAGPRRRRGPPRTPCRPGSRSRGPSGAATGTRACRARGSTPRRTGLHQYIGSPRRARRHREHARAGTPRAACRAPGRRRRRPGRRSRRAAPGRGTTTASAAARRAWGDRKPLRPVRRIAHMSVKGSVSAARQAAGAAASRDSRPT